MEFTWMTSRSSSLKWRPFISRRGLWRHHNVHALEVLARTPTTLRNSPLLCSDGGAAVRSISDPGLHSTSLSPQSVSSGGDSGVDSYCDNMADLPSITISLCGGLTDNREITKGMILTDTAWTQRCKLRKKATLSVCVCPYRSVPREDHLLPAVCRKPLHHRRPQLSRENWLQVRHSHMFVSHDSQTAVSNPLHVTWI